MIAADDLVDALIGNINGMYLVDVEKGECQMDAPHAISCLLRIMT